MAVAGSCMARKRSEGSASASCQQSVSKSPSHRTTWHRVASAALPPELRRWSTGNSARQQRVGAALASHGRSHRFDPCHAHQHKRLPGDPAATLVARRSAQWSGGIRSRLQAPRMIPVRGGIAPVRRRQRGPPASVGRPGGPLRPRRTGLESVQGLLPRGERLEDKGGAARLLFVEECRALQLIALGNRAVLEDVAPATRPPTMLRVTRRHKQEHVSTARPMASTADDSLREPEQEGDQDQPARGWTSDRVGWNRAMAPILHARYSTSGSGAAASRVVRFARLMQRPVRGAPRPSPLSICHSDAAGACAA
jgi:hypothetical protein